MNRANKVVWSEGMFLRPHHFQQAESYLHSQICDLTMAQYPWCWGFLEILLDSGLLKQGKVALSAASGMLPDGTWFSFSDPDSAPMPLAIDDNLTHSNIVLALPTRRQGREEVIFSEEADSLARFISFEREVTDFNALSPGEATVQFGRLRLRLMPESELSPEWTAITVVRVNEKQASGIVELDHNYIPPMLNAKAHPQLMCHFNDIRGLVSSQAKQLALGLKQSGRLNSAEMTSFMLLATLNRYSGLLDHLEIRPLLHPEQLYREWLSLAAELSTWTPERISEKALPDYTHNDLTTCFDELVARLRLRLSQVTQERVIQLTLDKRSHGLNVAAVPSAAMIRECDFVLAVKASVASEILQMHFPAQMKIAPVSKIRDLVQLQLPGMILRAMPTAPPQLPWNSGYSYFELEKSGNLWSEMEKSGAFALHLAGEFPELSMEFWAIRNPSL